LDVRIERIRHNHCNGSSLLNMMSFIQKEAIPSVDERKRSFQ